MEEEKKVPERTPSFVFKDDDGNAITDTDSPHKPAGPEATVDEVTESPKLDTSEDKTVDQDNPAVNQEDSGSKAEEPAPPEIVHTLESTSKDVDGYLLSLPSLKAALQLEVREEDNDDKRDESKDDNEDQNDDESAPKTDDAVDEEEKLAKTLEIPGYVDKFLDLVEEKIVKHHSGEGKGKWSQIPEDEASFFEAVDRLTRLYESLAEYRSDPIHCFLLNRIGGIQQRAMSFLEDEFRAILEEFRVTEPEHSNSSDAKGKHQEADRCNAQESESNADQEINYPGYSDEVVSHLNKIANEMINGGHEFECCEIYMIARRTAIDESLSKISGFEKVSIDEVQKMHWEALEREIAAWSKTFKQCATLFFSGEHKLANSVFSDHPSISASLFSNLTRGVVIQLLNFAEAVAITKRSTEKLFKFLDMYEALRDNASAIDSLFPEECANELKAEISTARSRLGEAAICIFGDLEVSIRTDQGKTPVPGGAVHPLTRYTLNYLKYACEYKDTLEQVFKEHSKIERADSTSRPYFNEGDGDSNNNNRNNSNNNNDSQNQSPFTCQLMRIMDLLDVNLEAKSKLYKDISLSCIFMMNNGRYILQKIKGSAEIYQKMGDTWCRKRSSELRNYHKNYQRETWTKLLGCLGHEGLMEKGKVVKPVLKERFKSFNAMFDEIHKTQSSWVVSDEQLQSELRVSISAVVIPAYRSFLGRFSQYLDPGRQTEKYIKFQPEDIETYIDELFDGNPTSMVRRRL